MESTAVCCGLPYCLEALSIPDEFDVVARQFALSNHMLKVYDLAHNKLNHDALVRQLSSMRAAQRQLIITQMPKGLFSRLKQAYRPVIDELISEMEGALGITHNTES